MTVSLENISFSYGEHQEHSILKNLSLKIEAGTSLAIIGQNGIGKSTLLKIMAGLIPAQNGKVYYQNQALESFKAHQLALARAYLDQENPQDLSMTGFELVALGRHPHLNWFQTLNKQDYQIIEESMELCNCTQFSNRPMNELSGGEKMRVWLACVLAQEAPRLFLDEPFNFLDLKQSTHLLELLQHLQKKRHMTIVAIVHDIALLSQAFDQVLILGPAGQACLGPAQEILTAENLCQYFGIDAKWSKQLIQRI